MTISDEGLDVARDFSLAAVLAAYPTEDLGDLVSLWRERGAGRDQRGRLDSIAQRARTPAGRAELEAAYTALFDTGSDRSSLNETEYGRMRGMSKGNDLADIAGFYRAFGLSLDALGGAPREMLDHLAVELEFYAFLIAKQQALIEAGLDDGVIVVRDARKAFLEDHLGRLALAIRGRAPVMNDPIYGDVFSWCADLILAECEAVHAAPAPLDFYADVELSEPAACADKGLPIVES